MILKVNNSGAVDLINGWSAGGRTRHMDTRLNFMRELKEAGIINVIWIAGENNASDLFTKNLPGPVFNKHTKVFCGDDEYGKPKAKRESDGE